MFTVRRLGVGDRLARTLTCTNAIESMISIGRTTARNVKRWRDGTMIKRWCAAGMLNAQPNFRRVKGCKDMPTLVAALRRHIEAVSHSILERLPEQDVDRHRTSTRLVTSSAAGPTTGKRENVRDGPAKRRAARRLSCQPSASAGGFRSMWRVGLYGRTVG
jgi:hypothetical protein